MSNGEFRSVEHRAVIHPNKERISVAMFHCPSLNLKLCPLPEFVKKGEKVRYRSTSYEDFLEQYFAAKLDGTERLERLKFFFCVELREVEVGVVSTRSACCST
jgi:isopenicillin N synthase-like dioxygenase